MKQKLSQKTPSTNLKDLESVITFDRTKLKEHLGEFVRDTVEESLNALLDAEADYLCGAKKYERSHQRTDRRAGYYSRKLQTQAGELKLNVPKLRYAPFETQIIERYRRKESSVEEALVEMYFAGVSVRKVEDITEALWGTRVSPSTVSSLNQKIYTQIESWRNRKLKASYPYVFFDGIWLKRSWGGETKNVSILVALAVNQDGYREVIGVAEGFKEDKQSWLDFFRYLKKRGLKDPALAVSDCCIGLVDALGDVFPSTQWQRCIVHFYRNVWKLIPHGKIGDVSALLKAVHAQEDRQAAQHKTQLILHKLKNMKLHQAAKLIEEAIEDTFSFYSFPREHQVFLRTNNPLGRIMKEIRRRTRVVGSFPDGHSALMLACARLRHITSSQWGQKRYLNMDKLSQHLLAA